MITVKTPLHQSLYKSHTSFLTQPALELFWPMPLLVIGIIGIIQPVLISVALALALLPWGLRWLSERRLSQTAVIGGPLALWIAGAGVGLAVSYQRDLSWPAVLTLLGSISLFFALINLSLSPRRISYGLVVIAALLASYFVGQYTHFHYPNETGWAADLGRFTGSFLPDMVFFIPHTNAVAGFLGGILILSLVLTLQAAGGNKIWWGGATMIIAYGLLVTGSRGSWVGLGTAFLIWLFLRLPRPFKLGGIGAIGLIGIAAAIYLFNSGFEPGSTNSWVDAGFGRLTLYRNSFFLWTDYPFTGIGPGETFAMIYSRYQLLIQVPFLTYPHNLFLAVGLGYGLPGLVALAWLLTRFYRLVFQIESQQMLARRVYFRAAWLGVTVLLIHGLTDSPQFSDARWTMPMFFALLGLSVAAANFVKGLSGFTPASPQAEGPRWGLIIPLVLGAAVIIGLLLPRLWGAWYSNLGAIYQTRADLAPELDEAGREATLMQALLYFEKALALQPGQPGANRRIGQIALEQQQFEAGLSYLERAHASEPENQATLKLLGYAHLWSGEPDAAEAVLRQIDDQGELVEELGNWQQWWAGQGREDLSGAAGVMAQRLTMTKE